MGKSQQTFRLFFENGFHLMGNSYKAIEQRVVVEEKRLSPEDFTAAVLTARALPGIFSLNFSAHLGRKLGGWPGSILAVAGTVLPAFLALTGLALIAHTWSGSEWLETFLRGVRPAVVALLIPPCIRLGRDARINLSNVILPLGAALAIWLLHLSPAYIVLGVAIIGFLYGCFVSEDDNDA